MKLSDLTCFSAIGWDFDGTLIANRNAPAYHRFILANPAIRHVIVTFRTHGWEKKVFQELRQFYPDPPNATHFEQVLNIDDGAYERYQAALLERLATQPPGPPHPAEAYYKSWKGRTCSDNGLPVLIDDDLGNTELGCSLYGVLLVDSLALDAEDED